MQKHKYHFSIMVILAFCFSLVPPIFAGQDDDCGDNNGWDFNIGCGWTVVPLFFPDFDYHRGRALIQYPGPKEALPCVMKKAEKQVSFCDKVELIDKREDFQKDIKAPLDLPLAPLNDKPHKKNIVALDHGSKDNPYMVSDNGLLHLGMLLGGGIVEPHTWMQANVLSKMQLTKGEWTHRFAKNHDEAQKMKWGKTPKKISDFDNWEIGDWMRKQNISGLTIYGGVGWFSPDARIGGIMKGIWSRTIQKIGETLIRVTFTREKEGGPVARAQAITFQKADTKFVVNKEDTRVYIFDLEKADDREALELLINKRMLPAKNLAEDLEEDGKGTLLTRRIIKRKRHTKTPFSFGAPLLFRTRFSHHNDLAETTITNQRNDTDRTITSKAYLRQSMHRHINVPKKDDGRKWKYFMHTHQNYNRSYAGSVAARTEVGDKDTIASRTRHLDVQIIFSHDNVKAKKVHKYAERISRKIGLNDVAFDTEYDPKQRIGYVEISYKLKVNDQALTQLINDVANNKHFFDARAAQIVDEYFFDERDPQNICDSSHEIFFKRCIKKEHEHAIISLRKIEKYLRKLDKEQDDKSAKPSAKYLANIAKELSVSPFVLQTFLMSLPPKENGYGKLEIFGEKILAKRLAADPHMDHTGDLPPEDIADDDNMIIIEEGRNAPDESLDI